MSNMLQWFGARNRMLDGAVLILGSSQIFLASTGLCDAIFMQDRKINREAAPDQSISAEDFDPKNKYPYLLNGIGYPLACSVEMNHPAALDPQRCNRSSSSYNPPFIQRAVYPATGTVDQIVFAGEAATVDSGGHRLFWNLINTAAQPGFVWADPAAPIASRRYIQFAYLSKGLVDNSGAFGGLNAVLDQKLYFRNSVNGALSSFVVDPTYQQLRDCPDTDPNDNPDDGNTQLCIQKTFEPLVVAGQSVLTPVVGAAVNSGFGANFPGIGSIGTGFDGDLLVPFMLTQPQNPANPTVTSFSDAYVLRGKWSTDGSTLTWTQSAKAAIAVSNSTRGADEPTVLELDASGRCIMVARGSNEDFARTGGFPHTPAVIAGHYWLFQSIDGCRTWTGPPTRWGFNDGTNFFAPAANSMLFRSPQNNRVYWIGDISASNSDGNWPRTTLIAAEVDTQNPGIIKDSATVIDKMDVTASDSDQLQLNNGQLSIQNHDAYDGTHTADHSNTAFGFWPRQDLDCTADATYHGRKPLTASSYYQMGMSTANTAQLGVVADSANLRHLLTWSSTHNDVVAWHLRRRFLSGDPLTDLWQEVGPPLPATSTGTTIAGYLGWQEAEYEVVAERPGGVGEVSNRVTARFATWSGPRLSFSFPTEANAGDHVSLGSVSIGWKYTASGNLTGFRLFRRFYNSDGTVDPWTVVTDLPASLRSTTMSGYTQDQRFDLYLQALDTPSQPISNAVSIRFPAQSNPASCNKGLTYQYLPY